MASPGPGQKLRLLRESLRLSLREVEGASRKIADANENQAFFIPYSRLFGIESRRVVPNIYRLYSLSAIYRADTEELMSWYGVDLKRMPGDSHLSPIPVTHRLESKLRSRSVTLPVALDPAFDPSTTAHLTMLVRKWGAIPMTYLHSLSQDDFIYGYMGTNDYTMYPQIMPGSFVQVDPSVVKVSSQGGWRSEYERPVYFIETRDDGFRIGWCSIHGAALTIHTHPLSPTPVKSYRHPQDAEIIGQVVGVATRFLVQGKPLVVPGRKAHSEACADVAYIHHDDSQGRAK